MLKIRILAAALVSICSQAAWASEASSMLKCANIADNTLRLACFDKVVGAQLPTLAEPIETEAQAKSVDVEKP